MNRIVRIFLFSLIQVVVYLFFNEIGVIIYTTFFKKEKLHSLLNFGISIRIAFFEFILLCILLNSFIFFYNSLQSRIISVFTATVIFSLSWGALLTNYPNRTLLLLSSAFIAFMLSLLHSSPSKKP